MTNANCFAERYFSLSVLLRDSSFLLAVLYVPPVLCNMYRLTCRIVFFRRNLHKTRVLANIDFRAGPRLSTLLRFDILFSPEPKKTCVILMRLFLENSELAISQNFMYDDLD